MSRVFIDTGHGQNNTGNGTWDPGTTSAYGRESDVVRTVANALLPKLKALGIDAQMAPDGPIAARMAWQSRALTRGDLFVSLHLNSGSASGTSVYYAATKTYLHDEACQLSADIASKLGIHDEGGKPDTATAVKSVGVLRANPDANQFLCELVHVGNEQDVKAVLAKGADAIAYGITRLVGPQTLALTPEEAAAWSSMRARKVYSDFTRPGTPVDTTNLAVFLSRLIP